jgi:hypothetical protein
VRQIEFLDYAIRVLGRLNIPYAVVGSYASSAWGEPRMTRDIDIAIRLSPVQIEDLFREFSDPSFYVSQTAIREAVQRNSQFNVIHPASGNKIDFMIVACDDPAESELARRKLVDFDSTVSGYVAAPEDVILGKLRYYREGGSEKHLRDIKGILKVSGYALDRDYLERRASELGLSEFWRTILNDPK